ncbi:hypothetical protein F5B20DRAFT_351163 [Whalleya microplaca]|nr:hypothetical protein F5B20DRAFT_351163 [Whalleya microplaca]
MDIQKATTRLRRTFAYPTDTSPPPSPTAEALDEQEQEELIATLAAQNETRNAQFRLLLLCLPAISALPYLVTLLFGGGGGGGGGRNGSLVAVLSLSSLGATAWTLWTLPPGVTGVRALDAWASGSGSQGAGAGAGTGGSARGREQRRSGGDLSFWGAERKSPLEQYLPYANIGLCVLLVLTGLVSKPGAAGRWGHVGLSNLPAIVYGVVLVSKAVMGGVDPERELGTLRYEYKGA